MSLLSISSMGDRMKGIYEIGCGDIDGKDKKDKDKARNQV